MVASTRINACELMNKLHPLRLATVLRTVARSGQALGTVIVLVSALAAFSADAVFASAAAQQPDHSQPTTQEAAPGVAAEPTEHAEGEEEHHSVWAGLLWPTVNFAILFGGLWYLLATPLSNYLKERHTTIRKDLVEAATVSATAQAQLAELDRKLQALPGEIEALRQRGAEEIAAEEARIAKLAAAERERLLEQTRREIDLQLRLAKRDLVEHTADLAVQLAGTRIAQQMTPADQDRIVDRYLNDVRPEQGR
jgi:F-type H+-transporting ATPase subunit b